MKEITKIDKKSLSKITAVVVGLLVFFATFCISVLNVFSVASQTDFSGSVFMVFLFNLGSGLIIGVLLGVVVMIPGYLVGYIASLAYDIFAKRFGGIKIELTDDNK